jgi:excisionase family DNA binding protein
MPRPKMKTKTEPNPRVNRPAKDPPTRDVKTSRVQAAEWPEVLTLAETAAYLRVPEAEVVRLVGPPGLPGRLIGSEWRFSRAAVQEWLRTPPEPSSRESLLALTGAWKDDPDVDDMLKEIYQRRGRPMTEDGS